MTLRRPIFAANWKMNKTTGEGVAFVEAFLPRVASAEAEVLLAPTFTALDRVGRSLDGSSVLLCSQNVNAEQKGAFTGEISIDMLKDVGCRYAIIGHSERRTLYAESDASVAEKAAALLGAGLRPIVCCGESLEERESERTFDIVGGQIGASLASVPADQISEVVLAYEPIWAIGTGKTATPGMAQEVHAFIRAQLRERFGGSADEVRIQYGGSVKPENVAELMAQPDIDGGLVGGASLEPESFSKIALQGA